MHLRLLLVAFLILQNCCAYTQDSVSIRKTVSSTPQLTLERRINEIYERHGLSKYELKSSDYNISFYDGGHGPALVLLHGFGADGSLTWHKQVKALSKNYRLIIPDLLWFGDSYSTKFPRLETQVEAMSFLLQALELESYALAGISYGGFVCLALAETNAESIRKVVLINSPGHTFNLNELDTLRAKTDVNEIEELFVPNSPKSLKRLLKLVSYYPVPIPKPYLRKLHKAYFSINQSEQKRLLKTLPSTTAFTHFNPAELDVEFAVIWGTKDEVFPLNEGERLANALNAEFIEIKNAGHVVNLERKRKFNKTLLSVLTN